jgi:hypothetical protein
MRPIRQQKFFAVSIFPLDWSSGDCAAAEVDETKTVCLSGQLFSVERKM